MIKLKPCQQNAVDELYLLYLSNKSQINFQAPTGAGKTLMMANLCEKLITNARKANKKIMICLLLFQLVIFIYKTMIR